MQFECVVSDKLNTGAPTGVDGDKLPYSATNLTVNTGPLGWLDYPSCTRVHGAYSYEDEHRQKYYAKRIALQTDPPTVAAPVVEDGNFAAPEATTSSSMAMPAVYSPIDTGASFDDAYEMRDASETAAPNESSFPIPKAAGPLGTESSLGLGMEAPKAKGKKRAKFK